MGRLLALLGIMLLAGGQALANCLPVAQRPSPLLRLASAAPPPAETARISFLGHASFLIESPGGAAMVSDYNGVYRPPYTPDIVTMNNSHSTHFTDHPDPGIAHVLRGWGTADEPPRHDIRVKDVRVRNVPTNARDWAGGTRVNGNSIFVYEVANLCIAHLGHLHHVLTDTHLAMLGQIDVLMVPIDGAMTMGQGLMEDVIAQIKPSVILPMHWFNAYTLQRFLERIRSTHKVTLWDGPAWTVRRDTLPRTPEVLVLPEQR